MQDRTVAKKDPPSREEMFALLVSADAALSTAHDHVDRAVNLPLALRIRSAVARYKSAALVLALLAMAARPAAAADIVATARSAQAEATRVLIAHPECGRLHGPAHQVDAEDVRTLVFADGAQHPACASNPHAVAYTHCPGSPVVICPAFRRLPAVGQAVVLVHETYHVAGAMTDEDGGGSDTITRAVLACVARSGR